MEQIKDGKGRGYLAGVNADNQLVTRSTSVVQHTKSAVDGNYYEIYSGLVTLTDAVETGIIYFQNGMTNYIVVDKVFLDVWASTDGVGGGKINYYKNPTYTGGSAITPVNTNFSRQDSLLGTYLKSLTTLTGGTKWWIGYFSPSSANTIEEEKFCIPPGYTFGISIQAPTSNTSMALNLNIAVYVLDINLLS